MSTTPISIDCFVNHNSWDAPESDSGRIVGSLGAPWRAIAKLGSPTMVRGCGKSPAEALSCLRTAIEQELGALPSFPLDIRLHVLKVRFPADRGGVEPEGGD